MPESPRPSPATTATPLRSTADSCPWCRGAGHYLERLVGGGPSELLPVVCQGCLGDGDRHERPR